jgi:drug/metabolite transporter (DMT)-like permease
MAGQREYRLAVLFIILDVLFWGFSLISTKVVLSQIPPISIAFFRQILAAITLMVLVFLTGTPLKVERRDLGNIVAASFFGIVMYFVLENTGLQYTTASNASMIVASLPMFTLFAEAMLFHLKVTWKMVLCLILSTVGVVLVVTVDGRVDLSARFFGNLLVMGAIVCWVFYTLLNRRLSENYPSLTLTALQSISSIFLLIPFILPEIERWPAVSEISLPVFAHMLFLSVFCSGFAYIFYIYATRRLGATVVSAFLNLIPVVTVVFGYLLLQDTLSWMQVLGMAMIMAAVYCLNRLMRVTKTLI